MNTLGQNKWRYLYFEQFTGLKYVWPKTTRSYQLFEIFVLVDVSYAIAVLNMNTSHQYTKESLYYEQSDRF